jgi:hypothetical protein
MRWIITFILLLYGTPGLGDEVIFEGTSPVSLSELAANADLVVLAQTRDTDYFMRRDIPVSGSAYLKVLIPYKVPREAGEQSDIIEVYEKGLHQNECYFPNPSVFEEGRRYLLFLRKDPENEARFRGLTQGCALDVLVNSDNSYALRYPVTGIDLSDSFGSLVRDMTFSDGYAIVDDEALLPALRDAMRSAGEIKPYDSPIRQWIYTRGVDLTDVRKLMEPEGLSH